MFESFKKCLHANFNYRRQLGLSREIIYASNVGFGDFDGRALPVPRYGSHQPLIAVGLVIDTDDAFWHI